MRVVHEGRGGYVELDEQRYPIEHVEGGRFCIHVSVRKTARYPEHLALLERLVQDEPEKWRLERR